MENFSNDVIDVNVLPKFEEVVLTSIHPAYWKVILFNILVTYFIIGGVAGVLIYYIDGFPFPLWVAISVYIFSVIITFYIARINFKNKGYAFRDHDVIYRTGAIAITTHIVPYNRIQHAASHEGILSRRFGLAAVEISTAGGDGSDIRIPGLDKAHAENVRQLIIGKIIKPSIDE